MRIVKRQELMELPEGTLYTVLNEPWSFGGLYIKGETVVWDGQRGDFYERTLQWTDGRSSDEAVNRLEEMLLDSNVSYPVEQAYGREGLFDDEMQYMVYEQKDIESILSDLTAYDLGATHEQ